MYRSILEREIENWESFASNLEKSDKDLFNQLLKFAYKYSGTIEAKGKNCSTQSLLMSLLLEQHKVLNKYL